MLLTVLILSGTMLGASIIAGLLMTYQIRQSTNISDSARAIYAADSGLEYEFYRLFKDPLYPKPILNNGAIVNTVVNGTTSIQSVGEAGEVARAFEVML